MLRNYWLDLALFALLLVEIATLRDMRFGPSQAGLSVVGHVHAIAGMLLALGGLAHIVLHRQWFWAVVTGKVKGKVKLVMNSLVLLSMLLAGLSGHVADVSQTAARLHMAAGTIALLELVVHTVKHARWMASVSKKLVASRQDVVNPLA
jgi:hypothetical protein